MAARSLSVLSAQRHVRGMNSVRKTELYVTLQCVQYLRA